MNIYRAAIAAMYRRAKPAAKKLSESIWVMCATAATVAGLLLWYVASHREAAAKKELMLTILEHASSALIVAAFMGVTYELLLNRTRKKEEREAAAAAISQVAPLLPSAVFELVRDIAKRSTHVPTLFEPVRSQLQESLFVENRDAFEQLLHLAAFRREEGPIIREWLADEDVRLRFLASDMIGLCRWKTFADELHAAANEVLQRPQPKDETEFSWALNFKWAASCCEDPRYSSLGDLLLDTTDPEIQKWILWVPVQVPDEEWAEIVGRFMKKRAAKASKDVLQIALMALDKIDERVAQRHILDKYKTEFEAYELDKSYAIVRQRMLHRSSKDRRRNRRTASDRRVYVRIETPLRSA